MPTNLITFIEVVYGELRNFNTVYSKYHDALWSLSTGFFPTLDLNSVHITRKRDVLKSTKFVSKNIIQMTLLCMRKIYLKNLCSRKIHATLWKIKMNLFYGVLCMKCNFITMLSFWWEALSLTCKFPLEN